MPSGESRLQTVPAGGQDVVRVESLLQRSQNLAVIILGFREQPHVRTLAALDVPGRVAAQVLALAREYGQPSPKVGTLIPLPLTQSDLAALVGGSRDRVNQSLGHFRRRGAISVGSDGRITVIDEEALARRAR